MLSASLVLPSLESAGLQAVGEWAERTQERSIFVVVCQRPSGNKDLSGSERRAGLCHLIQVVIVQNTGYTQPPELSSLPIQSQRQLPIQCQVLSRLLSPKMRTLLTEAEG